MAGGRPIAGCGGSAVRGTSTVQRQHADPSRQRSGARRRLVGSQRAHAGVDQVPENQRLDWLHQNIARHQARIAEYQHRHPGGRGDRLLRAELQGLQARLAGHLNHWVQESVHDSPAFFEVAQAIADLHQRPLSSDGKGWWPDVGSADMLATVATALERWDGQPIDRETLRNELIALKLPLFVENEAELNTTADGRSRLTVFHEERARAHPALAASRAALSSEESAVAEAALEAISDLLGEYDATVRPEAEKLVKALVTDASDHGVRVVARGSRRKELKSIQDNLLDPRKPKKDVLNQFDDLVGHKIIVEDMSDLTAMTRLIEKQLGQRGILLQKKNKYLDEGAAARLYEAVHYIVQVDETHSFEIQVKTRAAAAIDRLDHDLLYKLFSGKELSAEAKELLEIVKLVALRDDHLRYRDRALTGGPLLWDDVRVTEDAA